MAIRQKAPPLNLGGRPLGSKNIDGRTDWPKLLRPLMAIRKAGKWHLVRSFDDHQAAKNHAGNINKGFVRLPEGRWQARSHKTDTGSELYVMYLGVEEPPKTSRSKSK